MREAGAALVVLLALCPAAQAQAQVQVQAQYGRAIFQDHCASCHAVEPDAAEQAGPNLHGVIGRRVGSAPAFGYSPVLEAARDAGEIWDRDRLTRYLADPEEMYPGTWMGANGLRRAPEREAVAAYLQSVR